jgi:DNA-binding winged helix-turn-helix (wHTH) protein
MLNDSKKTEKLESESNIKLSLEELKLYNIFLEEYNDIFPKILSLNEKTIF